MIIKDLEATFRGSRKYLHSATVINHVYKSNIKFKEIKFHKFTKNQIEFTTERTNNLFGEIYLNNKKKNENIIFMHETSKPITSNEEYHENEIVNMLYEMDNKLIFNTITEKFTIFDITIAMVKQLNHIQQPTKKKWVAASYKLLNDNFQLYPKHKITVEIGKLLSGNFSNNNIYYNSTKIAESKFFLI